MPGASELRLACDRSHESKPAPDRPEEEVVAFARHLGQQLSPGVPILDAGCGRGRHVIYLAQQGFQVCGCDLSPVAIREAMLRAQHAGLAAALHVANLTRLPYEDGAFAAALCVHVLPYHYRAHLVRAVGELRRVVRPGGLLYLDLLACEDAEYGCGPELEPHTFLDPGGMPVHFSSLEEVDELLRGLVRERVARFELASRAGTRVGWTVWARKMEGTPHL